MGSPETVSVGGVAQSRGSIPDLACFSFVSAGDENDLYVTKYRDKDLVKEVKNPGKGEYY